MPTFQEILARTVGGADDPNLTSEQNAQRAAQQRQAVIATLLANSGPKPVGTDGGLAPYGRALLAGQAAGSNATENMLRAQLLKAQLAKAQAPDQLIGSASPSDFTPDSLAKYQQTRNPADLAPIEKSMFGRFQPRDYTPESLELFNRTHDPGDLRRVANYQPQQLPGGGIGSFNPVSGQIDQTPVGNPEAQRQAADL